MSTNVTKIAEYRGKEHANDIAKAYDLAGDRYRRYADGNLGKLFVFDGSYSYCDRQTWSAIENRLHLLRMSGARRLRLLDLGCGPGTWLRRIVARARQMGFAEITGHGIDISESQIRWARMLSDSLSAVKGVTLTYEVGNVCDDLSATDKSIDICLCLYGVLNHIAAENIDRILREIERVTLHNLIASVRTVGSTPTIYVDSVATARRFYQDNRLGKLEVEFHNGTTASFESHLYTSEEIRALLINTMEIEDICGLDLFHGRFAFDPRWNPPVAKATEQFARDLAVLEDRYSRNHEFIDHATHLLLIARPKTKEI